MMRCAILRHAMRAEFLPDVPRAVRAGMSFIGWTATSGSTSLGVPHDLNVYPWCARWWFMARRYWNPQLFETSLRNGFCDSPKRKIISIELAEILREIKENSLRVPWKF